MSEIFGEGKPALIIGTTDALGHWHTGHIPDGERATPDRLTIGSRDEATPRQAHVHVLRCDRASRNTAFSYSENTFEGLFGVGNGLVL